MDLATGFAGLLGDDGIAEHGLGLFMDVIGRLAEVHASFEAVLEYALAPTAGMNLDLEYDHVVAIGEETLCDGACLFRTFTGLASRDFDPLAGEQLLGLVFVKIHFSQLPKRQAVWLLASDLGIKRIGF